MSGGVDNILKFIVKSPNLKANNINDSMNTPLRTIQRALKQLNDEDKIEFRGSPKSGGYYAKNS